VIPPGVLVVRRYIMPKFVLWTIAPKTDMPLEMILIAILWAICNTCCYNQFAMPEVAVYTENIVIPAFGAGILFIGDWVEHLPVYFIQHLSACVPLIIQLLMRNIAVLDQNC
jgi:hypothetical protein